MNQAALAVIVAVVIIVVVTILAAIKVVQEYERGVVFRLGRLVGARGPGVILLIPYVERMVKVDFAQLDEAFGVEERVSVAFETAHRDFKRSGTCTGTFYCDDSIFIMLLATTNNGCWCIRGPIKQFCR